MRTEGILKACLLIESIRPGLSGSLQSHQNPFQKQGSPRRYSRKRSRLRAKKRRSSNTSKKRLKFEAEEIVLDNPPSPSFSILREKESAKGSVLDLFNQDILNVLSRPRFIKTRLYLMRGLNLTAQADVNSAMNKFAGYSAFSSANSFPQIVIGDGDNDHLNGERHQASSSRSRTRRIMFPTLSIRSFTATTSWTLLCRWTGASRCRCTTTDCCSETH